MKIAVVVAGSTVPAWHAWTIDALRAVRGADVSVVAVDDAYSSPSRGLFTQLAGSALASCTIALGDRLDGLRDADVVVDLLGSGRVFEARFGSWSLRLGDAHDTTLPFAREIAAGAKTFEVALVSRSGERRERLRRGVFSVTAWYPSTLRIALAHAASWPAVFAAALNDGVPLDTVADAPPPPPSRSFGPTGMLRFSLALAARLASRLVEYLFEVVEWNVGFARGGPRTILAGEPLEVRWLPRPPEMTYLADPFIAEHGGTRALFVEQFDYRRGRGIIEAHVLADDGTVVRHGRVLDLPTHLSYPYPLEIGSDLYLLPESSAANEVVLYRCVDFPWRWERERSLLPDFDGVDTTLFPHDGRWWAFATRYCRGSTVALYAFHGASPRGPWTAHTLNPIIVDVASARSAGRPFVVDGTLYRPSQDCSTSYGGGIVVARVDELSPTAYRETVVRRLDGSGFGRWNDGVHTLSFSGNQIVLDGKHVYHDLRKPAWAARSMRASLVRLIGRRRLLMRSAPGKIP
ncbi:MAG: hypothetical protein JWO85_1346 [Candidatus Eremiobacteraeota bacterium]|nr:hypothetical protein [Candidatus Eremiobacteraeota bacterium]